MLIGLAGYKRSGKDTVASILVKEYGFRRIAFADVLKQVAEDIDPIILERGEDLVELSYFLEWNDHDWEDVKSLPSVRRFLQNLGVAVRNVDPQFWVRNSGIMDVTPEENVVVSDVRFPNEVAAILGAGGKVYRVDRGAVNVDKHITETALDNLDLPVIDNTGTLGDLVDVVKELVENGLD